MFRGHTSLSSGGFCQSQPSAEPRPPLCQQALPAFSLGPGLPAGPLSGTCAMHGDFRQESCARQHWRGSACATRKPRGRGGRLTRALEQLFPGPGRESLSREGTRRLRENQGRGRWGRRAPVPSAAPRRWAVPACASQAGAQRKMRSRERQSSVRCVRYIKENFLSLRPLASSVVFSQLPARRPGASAPALRPPARPLPVCVSPARLRAPCCFPPAP